MEIYIFRFPENPIKQVKYRLLVYFISFAAEKKKNNLDAKHPGQNKAKHTCQVTKVIIQRIIMLFHQLRWRKQDNL